MTGQTQQVPSDVCPGGITALQPRGWRQSSCHKLCASSPANPLAWFGMEHEQGCGLHTETPAWTEKQHDEQSWTQNRPVKTVSRKTELFLHRSLTCWSEKQQPARGDWPHYHTEDAEAESCLKDATSQTGPSLASIFY